MMKAEHVEHGIRTRAALSKGAKTAFHWIVGLVLAALPLGFAPTIVHASATTAAYCGTTYDPTITYPSLPSPSEADVVGEAGYELYLHQRQAVVDLYDCFYTVDRPLDVDFGEHDFVTVLVELPDQLRGARVFVTQDGVWTETIDVGSEAMFSYVMTPDHSVGFEIATTGQALPTKPTVINRPTGGNPG